jgi:hypothetical protein
MEIAGVITGLCFLAYWLRRKYEENKDFLRDRPEEGDPILRDRLAHLRDKQ